MLPCFLFQNTCKCVHFRATDPHIVCFRIFCGPDTRCVTFTRRKESEASRNIVYAVIRLGSQRRTAVSPDSLNYHPKRNYHSIFTHFILAYLFLLSIISWCFSTFIPLPTFSSSLLLRCYMFFSLSPVSAIWWLLFLVFSPTLNSPPSPCFIFWRPLFLSTSDMLT